MVSILIPIYNGIEYINESVSSVLSKLMMIGKLLFMSTDIKKIQMHIKWLTIIKNDEKIKVLDLFQIKGNQTH